MDGDFSVNSRILENIKGVLFDVAGTLYISEEFDRQFPLQLTKLLSNQLHITHEEANVRLTCRIKELSQAGYVTTKVAAMATFGFSRSEVHEAFEKVDPSCFLDAQPRLRQLLESFKVTGFKTGILSNFRFNLIQKILGSLEIDANLFDFYVTEDDGLPIKPSIDPYLESIKRFCLPAREIAFVGDSLDKDMRPAKTVGMRTIWVKAEAISDALPSVVDIQIYSVLDLDRILNL